MSKIFNVLIFVFIAGLTAMNAGTVFAGCYGTLCAEMVSAGGAGSSAVATVTNGSDVPQLFTFRSYKEFVPRYQAGWLSKQVLFDTQSVWINAKETKQLSVKNAGCLMQSDLYLGEGVTSFFNDNPSSYPNILTAAESIDSAICTTCQNQCTEGQRECSGSGYKECRKTSDGCFEWSQIQCASNEICSNGTCIAKCTDECAINGQHVCEGSGFKQCGNFDSDSCLEWSAITNCATDQNCNNGSCVFNFSTVDLTANASGSCAQNATLSWTSTNATSCYASGSWSGNKSTSGTESVGNFTGSRTYTLTCSNSGLSASDSVTLDASDDTLEVDAGSDKTVDAGESIRLDGSVNGDYTNVTWNCTSGNLSNRNSLRPTYDAPGQDYNYDKTYTCTLTARNECSSDSDSMRVTVRAQKTSDFSVALTTQPESGCAPLNGVDLTARLSNYGDYSGNQDYTYYFDCENDGDWEKTFTTSNASYTAYDLCNYRNAGDYTARVRVDQNGHTAYDTQAIVVNNCNSIISTNLDIKKWVRNLSNNSQFQTAVTAKPLDIVTYKIIVTGGSSEDSNDINVSDVIPNGITNIREVQVNGSLSNETTGDLVSGINVGNLGLGQTAIITYTGTVANENNFGYGQNTVTNTATARDLNYTKSASATVYVLKQAVLGATTVSTGFTNPNWIPWAIVMLFIAIGLIYRKNILGICKKLFIFKKSN